MNDFRELFLGQLLDDARHDQPDLATVLKIQQYPEKVRIVMESDEGDLFFFDYDGSFSDLLLQMLDPNLAEIG